MLFHQIHFGYRMWYSRRHLNRCICIINVKCRVQGASIKRQRRLRIWIHNTHTACSRGTGNIIIFLLHICVVSITQSFIMLIIISFLSSIHISHFYVLLLCIHSMPLNYSSNSDTKGSLCPPHITIYNRHIATYAVCAMRVCSQVFCYC